MTDTAAEIRSVVVECDIAYPSERIWRALTQPHLIEHLRDQQAISLTGCYDGTLSLRSANPARHSHLGR